MLIFENANTRVETQRRAILIFPVPKGDAERMASLRALFPVASGWDHRPAAVCRLAKLSEDPQDIAHAAVEALAK